MHIPPWVALSAWLPLSLLLFRRGSLRIAILINFLGGWALLPGADYTATKGDFPYTILPVCLPSTYFLTKATTLGLTAILGILLFHRERIRHLRKDTSDLLILLWCIVPLCSALANGLSVGSGLVGSAYLFLAWIVPYFSGRLFLRDQESLLLLTYAIVAAGLLYIPICILELFTGPQVYFHIYGYEPFRWIGAPRYFGFRPIGFLEDGNQLGVWMATSALVAFSLWAHRSVGRILGIPARWAALSLAAVTLLCQSAGSILLLVLLLPLAIKSRRDLIRVTIATLLGGVVLFITLQLTHVVSWREIAHSNPVTHAIVNGLRNMGRESFAWRLGRDESQMGAALHKPLFGSGEWAWWRAGGVRPWDIWTLVFGMYGMFGVFALGWILVRPVIGTVWLANQCAGSEGIPLAIALAGILVMTILDSVMNGAIILPYLLVAGALCAPWLPGRPAQRNDGRFANASHGKAGRACMSERLAKRG